MTVGELLSSQEYTSYYTRIGQTSDRLLELIQEQSLFLKSNVKELAASLCAANLSVLCRITDDDSADFYNGIRKAITVIQQGIELDKNITSGKMGEALKNLVSTLNDSSSAEDIRDTMFLASCFSVVGASVAFYEQFEVVDLKDFKRYIAVIESLTERLMSAMGK